jgi:ATP synthase protein I
VFEVVLAQAVLTGILSLLGLFVGQSIAMSVCVGGFVSVIANCWMAWIAHRARFFKTPAQVAAALYLGEAGKFIVVALLFLLIFKKVTLFKTREYALLVLAGFLTVQIVVFVYPLVRAQFKRV